LNIGVGDTYIFNVGDGQDRITDVSYSPADGYSTLYNDTLSFGAGITPASIQFVRSGNDLIFRVSATDQVTVTDWYLSKSNYIERVTFADGTVWNDATLRSLIPAVTNGTEAGETIT